jgi:hypothetical protein
MQFSLSLDATGRPHLELRDAPPSVTALDAAPPELEPMLEQGAWLVMVVPAWSAPDIAAIGEIEGVAQRFSDSVRFGIRPFEDVDELRSWVSGIDWGLTPIWLAFRDGKVRGVRRGSLDGQALTKAVEEMLFSGE